MRIFAMGSTVLLALFIAVTWPEAHGAELPPEIAECGSDGECEAAAKLLCERGFEAWCFEDE